MSAGYPYRAATDPYPRQDAGSTRIHAFYGHLRAGRLTTTRCRACGYLPWPPRVLCPECRSEDLEWVDLPRQGTVHGFTVQEAAMPPGFDQPAIFAIVDVGGRLIFSRLIGAPPAAVAVGMPVEFTTIPVPAPPDGEERILHAFRPVTVGPEGVRPATGPARAGEKGGAL